MLLFFQFYYPYAPCYVTQIQMILWSQTLHISINQTDKGEYESWRIWHVEKLATFNYSIETHSDFSFLFRYNKLARECTQKHAMWMTEGSTTVTHPWTPQNMTVLFRLLIHTGSGRGVLLAWGTFSTQTLLDLTVFTVLFYFPHKLALLLLLLPLLLLLLVVVRWPDCIFFW